jgi:hypothetical protein
MERHNVNYAPGQVIPVPVLDTMTQLYFGVTDRVEMHVFVDQVIAQRLSGFTFEPSGAGNIVGFMWGYYKGDSEQSARVTIVHANDSFTNLDIEYIRSAYKERFKQESVLRVDSKVVVSF